jgi:hypothetical protein
MENQRAKMEAGEGIELHSNGVFTRDDIMMKNEGGVDVGTGQIVKPGNDDHFTELEDLSIVGENEVRGDELPDTDKLSDSELLASAMAELKRPK